MYHQNFGGRSQQGHSWATPAVETEDWPKAHSEAAAEPGTGSKLEFSKQSCSDTISSDISTISSIWKMMAIQTSVPSINMLSKYLFCSRNRLVYLNHLTIGKKDET